MISLLPRSLVLVLLPPGVERGVGVALLLLKGASGIMLKLLELVLLLLLLLLPPGPGPVGAAAVFVPGVFIVPRARAEAGVP